VIGKSLLSGVFAAGVAFRNSLYDSGRLQVDELRGPVVSIGNISVGGSGKTPFTILLGSLLKQRGIPFDILSRGYRRESHGARIVDPNGSAREFGDEPILLARELGVDVIVGESRYEAGALAEKKWGPRLHLLDDGFQHRRLARQFDIVLLAPEDLRDTLLPSGRLREPLSALSRADGAVITGDLNVLPVPQVWRVTRELSIPPDIVHPIAFCGIAKPHRFFEQLRAKQIGAVAEVAFRDHHRYTHAEVARLQRLAQQKNADSFLTTAKDAINLEPVWQQKEMWGGHSCPPLHVAKLKLSLENPDAAIDFILATLRERGKPAS
jgi:tetraacyldisaccharide 4'-kinase